MAGAMTRRESARVLRTASILLDGVNDGTGRSRESPVGGDPPTRTVARRERPGKHEGSVATTRFAFAD